LRFLLERPAGQPRGQRSLPYVSTALACASVHARSQQAALRERQWIEERRQIRADYEKQLAARDKQRTEDRRRMEESALEREQKLREQMGLAEQEYETRLANMLKVEAERAVTAQPMERRRMEESALAQEQELQGMLRGAKSDYEQKLSKLLQEKAQEAEQEAKLEQQIQDEAPIMPHPEEKPKTYDSLEDELADKMESLMSGDTGADAATALENVDQAFKDKLDGLDALKDELLSGIGDESEKDGA